MRVRQDQNGLTFEHLDRTGPNGLKFCGGVGLVMLALAALIEPLGGNGFGVLLMALLMLLIASVFLCICLIVPYKAEVRLGQSGVTWSRTKLLLGTDADGMPWRGISSLRSYVYKAGMHDLQIVRHDGKRKVLLPGFTQDILQFAAPRIGMPLTRRGAPLAGHSYCEAPIDGRCPAALTGHASVGLAAGLAALAQANKSSGAAT